MKRVLAGVAVGAALLAPGSSGAAVTLQGTYSARIAGPAQLAGTWSVHFVGYPRYVITRNGKVVVRGHYATVGTTIQFNDDSGPLACSEFGVYRFTRTAKTISFARTDDPCPGRPEVLVHRFTRDA